MLKQPTNDHIESWDRFSTETLRKLAKDHDVKITSLSGDWILRLKKDGVERHVFGLDWGLNSSVSKKIASDKCATADVLSLDDIPVVPHKLFLQDESLGDSGNTRDLIVEWFEECGNDVVCKPNNSGGGRDIVRVQDQETLEEVTQELFEEHRAIAISPYVKIQNEYRVTMLEGEALLFYEKLRADENELKFNLSNGARAVEIEDKKIHGTITSLARKAAKSIGITFANVDIVRVNNELYVLEINSEITFKHYVEQGEKERILAREVYEQAFLRLMNIT